MVGKTLSHYKIIEKLGSGGMGTVYKARDTKLDRFVALKFLPQHLSQADEEKKRFIHEAKAASALDHPNICTIHEVDETKDGQMFIVMACYDGESLKAKIDRGPLPLDEAMDIAIQVGTGLAKAHEQDIVHRDIKPANVMITKDGVVKIVDFGLAKLRGQTKLTKAGTTLGTTAYMSPEQAQGQEVDCRTDIFSFGVLVYEMLDGRQPFEGDYEPAIVYSILNEEPRPLNRNVSEELKCLVFRALEKERDKRFQSVDEILQQLQQFSGRTSAFSARALDLKSIIQIFKKPRIALAAVVVIILLIGIVAVPYYQLIKRQRAKELLPQIESSVKERKYYEAYQTAIQAEKYLKNDSAFVQLLPGFVDYLTLITNPEGALVYLKRFAPEEGGSSNKEYVGRSPIHNLRVIRGGYKIFLDKEGYVPSERVLSSNYGLEGAARSPDINIEVKLLEVEKAIEKMVFIPGGKYQLVGWGSPTIAEVHLDDYFIDKYEVSNNDYKAFVDAGGYSRTQYWKYSFIRDGKEISWKEGIKQFRDHTGLPGPRNWLNQEFPGGKGNHPVTNITWYEAAAYAEFVNKKLPTLFQWEKAVRDGEYHVYDIVMPWGLRSPNENVLHRANFEGQGTVAVDSFEFGISPYGCYNMAGNVKEWCVNEITGGFLTTGGSWEDPLYMFAEFGSFPGFYASNSIGFRCVSTPANATGKQGAMKINLQERIPVYTPVDKATFKTFLTHFKYDKKPLNARVIETTETVSWTKEKVTFSGVDDERIIAYLYLPTGVAKPYQCLNFIPHSGVIEGQQLTDEATEHTLGPQIKAGRAVLVIVPKGARERPHQPGYQRPDIKSVKYREHVIHYATEFSLGLDYLATRDDIDMARLAYIGLSWGAAGPGLIFAAIENRYRSVIFLAGGIRPSGRQKLPEVNPINFVPYIKPPKLLLNGRYDEAFRLETEARPLYKLLREPKQFSLVDAGHVPPLEKRVPIINKWLDETLGSVRFED